VTVQVTQTTLDTFRTITNNATTFSADIDVDNWARAAAAGLVATTTKGSEEWQKAVNEAVAYLKAEGFQAEWEMDPSWQPGQTTSVRGIYDILDDAYNVVINAGITQNARRVN
jgi:uncharacterized lipoprotein NlpE involved in copper resistance